MSTTASEAHSRLFPLIEQVNDDQIAIEIVTRRCRRCGNAPSCGLSEHRVHDKGWEDYTSWEDERKITKRVNPSGTPAICPGSGRVGSTRNTG